MPITILVHIANEDPVVGEIEVMPDPKDTLIVVKNPRRRDGKDIHYLGEGVTTVVWPISRIVYIEIMTGEEEEPLVSFVRE
ncbi:MAG: hypothetical protein MUO64_03420 [Anaerolineales bacterium]|jgi:hypothetical protein|nr:hypothetical protein [Anaerolineales bacterium]